MALALILAAVSPEIGGVLVRGEKGTAKTTMVRGLAAVLPEVVVVEGCRFSCDPADPDPACPDGPHPYPIQGRRRPARLVELPVGATEDRVIGSLDLQQALGAGQVAYQPGLLAEAHRGILYVDEVNLLHDHLVDLLLDAVAMGRSTVEREGVSIAHASRVVLVGTMNPEEGELRPQLLDRFGLTVEVAASRDPHVRAEVIRRRLAYERDAADVRRRLRGGGERARRPDQECAQPAPSGAAGRPQLVTIARVCAGFEVDGMRADIVTARTAVAHAAWHGRDRVEKADLRAAARLALPHRRRRNPFDAPGLDEELLDRLLDAEPEPEPEGPGSGPDESSSTSSRPEGEGSGHEPVPSEPESRSSSPSASSGPDRGSGYEDGSGQLDQMGAEPVEGQPSGSTDPGTDKITTARAGEAYRTRRLVVSGVGAGDAGRRSRAITSTGRTVGASPFGHGGSGLHLPGTIRAAAPHQRGRGRTDGGLRLAASDLRRSITEGRESNLVLFAVDASGSMAARRRMESVKTAILSLLLDAYQRRDKVGLVTFRGDSAASGAAADLLDRRRRPAAGRPAGRRTYAPGRRACSAPRRRCGSSGSRTFGGGHCWSW